MTYYVTGSSGTTGVTTTSCTSSSTASWATVSTGSTISGLTIGSLSPGFIVTDDHITIDGDYKVLPGSVLKLPDGTILEVDDLGNFTLSDKNAKVTYKGSNVREFNRHINASDLLESFIKDLGNLGVKQSEVLDIPIEIFINWLIFKAAEQDGDDTPDEVPLLESSVKPHKHPRCLCCGRFIKKVLSEHKILFCNPEHHELYLKRIEI